MPDQHPRARGREVMYAIRHPDGQPIGHDEDYAFLIVEGPNDWAAAADNSHDHPQPLDYELVRLLVEPLASRTYADGHRHRSADQAASTTPRAARHPMPDPAAPARAEVFYAIRRADGHGIGMEDAYEYIPADDGEDPWDIAAHLSTDDPNQVTYELIEVTHQPVLRRTYKDGHDIDDVPKDTPPTIRRCPGQTSLLDHPAASPDEGTAR